MPVPYENLVHMLTPDVMFSFQMPIILEANRRLGDHYEAASYRNFLGEQFGELSAFVESFNGIIIGHNLFEFDYRILRSFLDLDNVIERTVDTLALLHWKSGDRFGGISLDDWSQVNRNERKSRHGASIPQLWQSGG